MSNEAVRYRPRNDHVIVRIEVVESIRGVLVPQRSQEGKRYIVEAVGPKVEDLKVGDDVLIGGKQNEDWALVPGSSELVITKENNVFLIIERIAYLGG